MGRANAGRAGGLIAPLLWLAPGRLPGWYVALWITTMVALALVRQSRAMVAAAGVVAACGATTLTWYEVSRARVQLAETEVSRLTTPDPGTRDVTERLVEQVRASDPPMERADLLRRFVESPLAAAGNPVELASWRAGDLRPRAELAPPRFCRSVPRASGRSLCGRANRARSPGARQNRRREGNYSLPCLTPMVA